MLAFYRNRFSIVVGPPGTGKSTLIDAILELEERFTSVTWVVTASNKSVNVLVDKMCKRKKTSYPDGFYRIKPSFLETLCSDDDRGSWSPSGPAARPMEDGQTGIWDFFTDEQDPEAKMALGVMIQKRLELLDKGKLGKGIWSTEEADLNLLRLYRTYIQTLRAGGRDSTRFLASVPNSSKKDAEAAEFENWLRRNFMIILRHIQQRLLANNRGAMATRGVFSAATGTTGLLLRNFRANTIIIDDASQATELELVYPIIHALNNGRLRRVLIVGDHHQLPPVIKANRNPFSTQGKLSLLERLLKAGFPSTMLREQYRMHPDISAVPNAAIYGGQLRDGAGTSTQNGVNLFRNFVQQFAKDSGQPNFPPTNSFIVSLTKHAGYHWGSQKKSIGHSRFNLQSAMVVARLVWILVEKFNFDPSTILVQAFYADQVNLIRAIFASLKRYKGLKIATVDGSQGDESMIGIVDSVVLAGGAGEPAGFLGGERRRFNVAMSRQMAGRIVVGHRQFCHGMNFTTASPWRMFYEDAERKNTIIDDRWFHGQPTSEQSSLMAQFNDVKAQYEGMVNTLSLPHHDNIGKDGSFKTQSPLGFEKREFLYTMFIEATQTTLSEAKRFLGKSKGSIILAINEFYANAGALKRVSEESVEEIAQPADMGKSLVFWKLKADGTGLTGGR